MFHSVGYAVLFLQLSPNVVSTIRSQCWFSRSIPVPVWFHCVGYTAWSLQSHPSASLVPRCWLYSVLLQFYPDVVSPIPSQRPCGSTLLVIQCCLFNSIPMLFPQFYPGASLVPLCWLYSVVSPIISQCQFGSTLLVIQCCFSYSIPVPFWFHLVG